MAELLGGVMVNSSKRSFLITIDTECDNGWARSSTVTTRNAAFLPRFQELCERFGLPPTYLTNYEMATSKEFVGMAKGWRERGMAEIGMHLHAWNSPPAHPLTEDDFRHHPYLIEYPKSVIAAKIEYMTKLLQDVFGDQPKSHRAGRWAIDAYYASVLVEHGYEVDCSVTPHTDWSRNMGAPDGDGGTDYRGFPSRPYFVDLENIDRPGSSPLLEIPTTVEPRTVPQVVRAARDRVPMPLLGRRVLDFVFPERVALIPGKRNAGRLLRLLRRRLRSGYDYVELTFHSSELMPGGSPGFKTEEDIDRLYRTLERVFSGARAMGFVGSTLAGYRRDFVERAHG